MPIVNPIVPLASFPYNTGTFPNVVPFTMREGYGQMELLEDMRNYLVYKIIPFINENTNKLGEEWVAERIALITGWEQLSSALIQEVNEAVAEIGTSVADAQAAQAAAEAAAALAEQFASDAEEIQDGAVNTIVNDGGSQLRGTLDGLYAAKAAFEIVADTLATGRLSATAIDDRFTLKADKAHVDAAINAIPQQQMERTLTVNVRDYDAVSEDVNGGEGATAEIQAAIDAVALLGGGDVVIDGDYWIKAHDPSAPAGNFLGDYGGIALKDGVHIRMSENGILRALPTSESRYVVVRSYNKSNTGIHGGRIVGDLSIHTGTTGEWGYGVAVTGSDNFVMEDVHVSNVWGDGVNLQRYVPTPGTIIPVRNARFTRITSANNRRQGMSIECAEDVIVEYSTFSDTGQVSGTAPMAGIDIEPVDSTTPVTRVTIRYCNFINNKGWGTAVLMNGTNNVTIQNCLYQNNQSNAQVDIITTGKNVHVIDCVFEGSVAQCIRNQGGQFRNFMGNTFDAPVWLAQNAAENVARDITIDRNKFLVNRSSALNGLVQVNEHSKFVKITNNWFENLNARGHGVWIRTLGGGAIQNLSDVVVDSNTFVNMSYALIAGAVERFEFTRNIVDASANAAINIRPLKSVISQNTITGSNLVTGSSAIFFQTGGVEVMMEGNRIRREPIATVAETRRGSAAIQFAYVAFTEAIIRNLQVKDLTRYSEPPTVHTDSYAETVPGSWYNWV